MKDSFTYPEPMCQCSKSFSPCEFCFYGACEHCFVKKRLAGELNPYCDCLDKKETKDTGKE